MADDNPISQDDIDRMLDQSGKGAAADEGAGQSGAGQSGAGQQLPASEAPPANPGPATQAPQSPDDGDKTLAQDGIDELLKQVAAATGQPAPQPASSGQSSPSDPHSGADAVAERDIEFLLSQAESA